MSLVRRLLRAITARMPHPRVIYDRSGRDPYLSRWYLLNAPSMPDGSWPFDDRGDPREGIVWGEERWGLYLHRFHRSDSDGELHNHPWHQSVSYILAGGYSEERRIGDLVYRRVMRPGALNRIDADDFHRVDLLEDDAWSLFLVGPKVQSWGFWNREDGLFTPWRTFVNRARS